MLYRRLTSLALFLTLAGCSAPGLMGPPDSTPATETVSRPQSPAATMPDTLAENSPVPPAVQSEYDRAIFLLEAGDQTGAESELLRFVAAHSGYPAPWVNLAIVQNAQGRFDEARASVDAALAIDADYAPAWNQLGILHRKSGNFAEAEAAYLNAVTVNPGYGLAHLNLGILNDLYLGDLESALSAYHAYQALQPEADPLVGRWIADLTRRTGQ